MLESIENFDMIVYELDENGLFTIEKDEDSLVLTDGVTYINLKENYETKGTSFIQENLSIDLKDESCFNYTIATINEVKNGN